MKLNHWIGFLFLTIALVILWQFRQVVLLIFTAVVLATSINGLVRRIGRRLAIGRKIAVFAAINLLLLACAAFAALVMPPFISQFGQLIQLLPSGFSRLLRAIDRAIDMLERWFPEQDFELLPQFSDILQQVGPVAGQLVGNLFEFFSNSVLTALQLLLVVVLTVMFLSDPKAYRSLTLRLFPATYRPRADSILAECEKALLNWLRGIFFNSIFVATLCAIGLSILGVQFVFANALLAGVFNFIPNIGPVLSSIFPISVALIDSFWQAIGVIILYVVVQNLETYWFSPMVMHRQVSLLPAITLISQLFFTTFFGILGLILALPLAVVSKTWFEEAFVKDVLDKMGQDSKKERSVSKTLPKSPEETDSSVGHFD
ncbi:AI-2E family transporter [Synechococcus sp. PCC 7336]|uniref:AI-2E family transporter n=1 Tax=Synechococcus sp. PCC 7336 TaxID=195250 RepID=UPI00034A2016|nr:AI-2E family transporter [Synechococcus sp. PCC 7336]